MPSNGPLRFGAWEVLGQLGAGSIGAVYRAWLPATGQRAAIKTLNITGQDDAARLERFRRGAHAMAFLNHANVVLLLEQHLDAEPPYLVLQDVDGTSLAERIRATGLSPGEAIFVVSELANGLMHAHSLGVLHLDLHPRNVLVSTDLATVKVTDFGFGRTPLAYNSGDAGTTAHVSMGSAAYAAPELMSGAAAIDARADVYSLGVVCYEALTGRLPIGRFGLPSELNHDVPEELDPIVLKCLASSPGDRYASVAACVADLSRIEDKVGYRLARDITRLSPAWLRGTASAEAHRGGGGAAEAVTTHGARGDVRLLAAGVAVAVLVLTIGGAWWLRTRAAAPGEPPSASAGPAGSAPPAVGAVPAGTPSTAAPLPAPAAPTQHAESGAAPARPAPRDAGAAGLSSAPPVATSPAPAPPAPPMAHPASPAPPMAHPAGPASLDSSGTRVPGQTGQPAASAAPPAARPAPANADARRLDAARSALAAIQAAGAAQDKARTIGDLKAWLAQYGATPLAPDALMLCATLQTEAGLPHDAIESYHEVESRFPASPHAGDALFDQAQLLAQIKASPDEIRQRLARIADAYPTCTSFLPAMATKIALEDRLKLREQDPELGIQVPASLITRRVIVTRGPAGPIVEGTLAKLAEMSPDLKQWSRAADALVNLATRFPDNQRDAWFMAAELFERRLSDTARAREAYLHVPPASPRYKDAQSRAHRLDASVSLPRV